MHQTSTVELTAQYLLKSEPSEEAHDAGLHVSHVLPPCSPSSIVQSALLEPPVPLVEVQLIVEAPLSVAARLTLARKSVRDHVADVDLDDQSFRRAATIAGARREPRARIFMRPSVS